ncbi:putative phosphatase regulatory subunit-domain-containing protein [Phyllosticta citribraziliensis]|uniref:Phosphatase regulatory subunit-domain-containing protein n=1 Tax=Phyllosticta citribraziliensis TaxID=989973 RepID=A0ABR1L4P7_9PEZI
MPYTPPSQRSPASSKPTSPILSRNHSYSEASQSPQSSTSPRRPQLPHSLSSTAYLSKHRRSPSISQATQPQNASNGQVTANGTAHHPTPPSIKLLIPVGAESTPPDSVQNSDDDERGRTSGKIAELHEALQSIELKRGHSPERRPSDSLLSPAAAAVARPALSAEARKISHSRSTSEIALSSHNELTESPIQTSDDSSEDDGLTMKPPLLRKKSGELVKPALRPTSRNRRRPSSMPGTPSFSKAVHFNDDIEQVRHFLQVDRPIAVSAGSSPVEAYDSEHEYPFGDEYTRREKVEWELRLTNFPRDSFERQHQPIRVEKICLSQDTSTLIGHVAVANIAFHKFVVARFTLDYWKTTSEVVAEYNNDVRRKQTNDGYDRFVFNIKLADQAHLESKTMLLCVRYNVNGQEFWDNNNSMNYQADFIKKTIKTKGSKQGPAAGTLGAIPRSRHSPQSARPRSMPASMDDDFGHAFDSKFEFDSTAPLRFKKSKAQRRFPDQAAQNNPQAFASRYDFGASLTAAIPTGKQAPSGKGSKPRTDYFARQGDAPAPTNLNAPRPDQLSSEKPDLKSAEYNELIQKYCFFGSRKNTSQSSAPQAVATDGTFDQDDAAVSPRGSVSGSFSPPQEAPPAALDGADDEKVPPRSASPFLSRSGSPGPVTGSDFGDRTTPPVSFGYPYNNNMHGGIFLDSHTPKAILG